VQDRAIFTTADQ